MRKLVILRRFSQIFFLFLFVYILWSTTYPLRGILSPEVIFKIDPLIMLLTAVSGRVLIPGLIFAFLMTGLTFFFGRFFCGWMCPLGTVIDMFGLFRNKKAVPRESQNVLIRSVKYVIFAVLAVLAAAGVQAAWVLDPVVTAARVVSLNVIPAMTFTVDRVFIFCIQHFDLYGPVYDFYRDLKSDVLGVRVSFFANSFPTLAVFAGIGLMSLLVARLWCRMLCPLGALYSLPAAGSLFSRRVEECRQCGLCRQKCRMGAIRKDGSCHKGECILCMDCVYDCPTKKTRFSFSPARISAGQPVPGAALSRRSFLFLMFSCWASLGLKARPIVSPGPLRPPGVIDDNVFLNTCVRCGNCMKVCITNGLQPVMFESGLRGLWTPQLVPEIGYCEYNCNLCGQVCPTRAIPRLTMERKHLQKLGVAKIDRGLCYAWAENKQCIVCEEHCPAADKAIKLETKVIDGREIYLPVVDARLCVGCGICQNKCPVFPMRAIRVHAEGRG